MNEISKKLIASALTGALMGVLFVIVINPALEPVKKVIDEKVESL